MKTILQKDLWSITSFLENQNFLFDKKDPVTEWEKNSTLDC